ncbi:hypothetical protein FE257_009683 [Aspergillus nanangensis]|uniref:Cytochrome P450 n=1 Tax=Aspergillus nanangensis TaxID=2582783 RepID=A0AAD4CJM8_ASPNN|nr:hypothetical protein FE257_009683 [Aspergillus nanangensis]
MNMLFNKVYVITSPELVRGVQRSHHALSLNPLFTRTAESVGGIKGPGVELLGVKDHDLGHRVVAAMRPTLLGEGLDHINSTMINCLQTIVQDLKTQATDNVFDLYDWCTSAMTLASTDAIYGPRNPYQKESVRKAYWEIEKNLSVLMTDVLPWLTARKAWQGREHLANAFLQFYQANGHMESSQLAYIRWKVQTDGGASLEDTARLEAVMGLGILSNTVPSSFWLLFDIFSRPELLAEIRTELHQNAVSTTADTGAHTVDLADIRDKCPLLLASFQETLRLRSNSAQLRVIHEDTIIGGSYLVKKGSILVMPAAVINKNKSAWGSDATSFDPARFMGLGDDKRRKSSAFMSFGVSPNICAGRHFATGEILALAAMLILQFDLHPAGGHWVEPPTNVKAVAASLSPPASQTWVTIAKRHESRGVKWHFQVTPGKGRYGLISG